MMNLLVALFCFFAGTFVIIIPPLRSIDVVLGLVNYGLAALNLYIFLGNKQ